jgi:hypothetical protein
LRTASKAPLCMERGRIRTDRYGRAMERGSEFEEAVRREWIKAIEHAGLDYMRCRLWFGRGDHQKSAGANYYRPARRIEGAHGLDQAQFDEAHSDECSELHRVIVYPEYEPEEGKIGDGVLVPIFGAILRHELQHALQFDASGEPPFEIDEVLIDHVLSVRAGGIRGSMALYNTKPMEIDGNAAAALFLKDVHPEHLETIQAGPCGQLGRSLVGPEDPSTFLTRQICFLYIHRDICRLACKEIPVANWIRTYSDEGAEIWERLEDVVAPAPE